MAKAKYSKSKDGYFRAKVWDGTYNTDGSKHRINLISKKSSADLEKKVNEFNLKVQNVEFTPQANDTFYDYALIWLDTFKTTKELATYKMYETIINKYFSDFRIIKVQSITRHHIQNLLNDNADKPRTCQKIALTFKQIIKSAIKDSILNQGSYLILCDGLLLPKYKAKERRPLTKAEVSAIKNACFTDTEKCLVYILYSCGLRREEVLALTVSDIDLEGSNLSVNKALAFDGNKSYIKGTKSHRGNRSVPLTPDLKEFLQGYLKSCKYYLFEREDGTPYKLHQYKDMWKSIRAKIEALDPTSEGLTAHIFRHNYCTRLCYQVPTLSTKMIAKLLGDSEKMVLDIYSHILEEKEDAQTAVSNEFSL